MSRIEPAPLPTAQGSLVPEVEPAARRLPDVAEDTFPHISGTLQRVGMSGVEIAIRRRNSDGEIELTPARADAFVSLDDPEVKGIHMSRLYLDLQKSLESNELSKSLFEHILTRFVKSHKSMSNSAYLKISFEHLERRSSLISDNSAWRSYPVEVSGELKEGQIEYRIHVRVSYSSACPCSAALSRQLQQELFQEEFGGHNWVSIAQVKAWLGTQEATVAIPHSQRSLGDVTVVLDDELDTLPMSELIHRIEAAVATPVQAVVKRADEQEFARLNGTNMMFCEDAARRLKASLDQMPGIRDYRIQASHLESLHPHDAVAIVTKGVVDGLKP